MSILIEDYISLCQEKESKKQAQARSQSPANR